MSILDSFLKIFSGTKEDAEIIRKQNEDATKKNRELENAEFHVTKEFPDMESHNKYYDAFYKELKKKNPGSKEDLNNVNINNTNVDEKKDFEPNSDYFLNNYFEDFCENVFLPDFKKWFDLKNENAIRFQSLDPLFLKKSLDDFFKTTKSLHDYLYDYILNNTNLARFILNKDFNGKLKLKGDELRINNYIDNLVNFNKGDVFNRLLEVLINDYISEDNRDKNIIKQKEILTKESDESFSGADFRGLSEYILENNLVSIVNEVIEESKTNDSNYFLSDSSIDIIKDKVRSKFMNLINSTPDILKDYKIYLSKKPKQTRRNQAKYYKQLERYNQKLEYIYNRILPIVFNGILIELKNSNEIVTVSKLKTTDKDYKNYISEAIKSLKYLVRNNSVKDDPTKEIASFINFCNVMHELNSKSYSELAKIISTYGINYKEFITRLDTVYDSYLKVKETPIDLIRDADKKNLLKVLNEVYPNVIEDIKKINNNLEAYFEQQEYAEDSLASIAQDGK